MTSPIMTTLMTVATLTMMTMKITNQSWMDIIYLFQLIFLTYPMTISTKSWVIKTLVMTVVELGTPNPSFQGTAIYNIIHIMTYDQTKFE